MVIKIPRTKGNLISRLDPDTKPIAEVGVGDVLVIETAHHLFLYKERVEETDLLDKIPKEIMNPVSGPIKVSGACAGDVLVLKILDIACDEVGDAATMPGTGLMRSRLRKPNMMLVKNDGHRIEVGDGLFVPVKPVIGCIGTTPTSPVIALMPGPHGGNLDDPNVTVGARVHLPVYVDGANFTLGDVHAAQADGEGICPIDINATVTVRIDQLVKQQYIPEARIETDTKWVIDKEADSIEEALEKACVAMTDFLKQRLQLSDVRIGLLLSSVGGFRISQSALCDYPAVVRAEIPKWVDTKGRL